MTRARRVPAAVSGRWHATLWGWVAAAPLVLLVGGRTSASDGNVGMGVLSLGFGVWAFVVHGGPRVTAVGLFNFACAIFVGYAGIVEATTASPSSGPWSLTVALVGAYAAQVGVTAVAWARSGVAALGHPVTSDLETSRYYSRLGGTALVIALVARVAGAPGATGLIAEGLVFSAVVLWTLGLLLHPRARPVSFRVVAILAAVVLYAEFFHAGTGRLRIVALACVLALVLSARFPQRSVKVAMVAFTPVAVWWLALDRLELQESLRAGSSVGRSGLESMLTPIATFAHVIQAQSDGWPLRWGATFLTLPWTVLPEALRPGWLPDAVGYDLVTLTAPHRAGTGFSEAGTAFGEWVWNFGVIGLALMVPCVGLSLGWVDRRLSLALAQVGHGGRPEVLRVAVYCVVAGSVADFAWAGLHTYGARLLTRMPLLLAVALLIWRQPRVGQSPRSVVTPDLKRPSSKLAASRAD